MQQVFDAVIIGAGPAGLTAGLYAGRFKLKTIILERMSPGGQIILSSFIENYPGFPGGVATQELIEKMKQQVKDVEVGISMDEALGIDCLEEGVSPLYNIKGAGNNYRTRTIVIASGAAAKKLNVLGEDKFVGKGVSYCATCDGPLYRNKEVVVVGGGDRAFEEALFLTEYASKVTLVHRRQGFRASEILIEKARANSKISFLLDTVIEEIVGVGTKIGELKLKNVITHSTSVLHCDGIFIFIGIIPNVHFLKNQLRTDELGFIITDSSGATSKKGIFACGDCCRKDLYQVVNACGEAAVAVFSAHKYLLESV